MSHIFIYLHQTNTTAFTIISDHLTIIYSSGVCATWRIINIAKYANSANNVARNVEFEAFDGAEDGGYNGFSFVEISKIFAKQASIFFEIMLFNSLIGHEMMKTLVPGDTISSRSYVQHLFDWNLRKMRVCFYLNIHTKCDTRLDDESWPEEGGALQTKSAPITVLLW